MNKRFLICKTDTLSWLVIDFESQSLTQIAEGNRTDVTEVCKKMYNADKTKPKSKIRVGASWFFNMTNYNINFFDEIIMQTDDKSKVNKFVFDKQIEIINRLQDLEISYDY